MQNEMFTIINGIYEDNKKIQIIKKIKGFKTKEKAAAFIEKEKKQNYTKNEKLLQGIENDSKKIIVFSEKNVLARVEKFETALLLKKNFSSTNKKIYIVREEI